MSEEAEPWDIPRSPESRDKLKSLGDDFRAEGKLREAGICYSRISHMLRWVGVEGEDSWVGPALNLGTEAIALLRQTDDKAELARALRVTASAFHPEAESMYEESLAIARECGARAEEARTLRQLAGFNPDLLPLALAIFEEIDDKFGIADCLINLGMKMPKPRDRTLFERGIALFKELGETEHAGRIEMIMESFCRPIGAYSTPLQAQRKLRRYVRQYKSGPKKIDKLRAKLNLRKPDAS